MKNLFLSTLLTIFAVCISQSQNNFNYQEFSNPNPKNELSLFFKKEVPKKLLKKAVFLPKNNNIVLSFSINKENKPYRISVTNYSSKELKKAIIEAFKKYPLENLNLETLDKRNRYHFQIISKNKSKNIFNCSSKIIIETPSICEPCKDLEFFEDLKNCLNLEVKKYFYENADFNLLNNLFNLDQSKLKDEKDIELYLYEEIDLHISFLISENGQLKNKKTNVPSVFRDEVSRLLETFSANIKSGTFNGKENKPTHSFTIKYKKGEKPVYKDRNSSYANYTKPSIENELSKFYSKRLTEDFLKTVNLNRIKNRLTISFELDKKNKPFNIKTSARSKTVEDKIITIFKEYPIEKLNFTDKRNFNNYIIQILSFKEGKIIVNTDSLIGYERVPIFPGCENSKDVSDVKKCFSRGIQQHFAHKFDASLPNRLGLSPGRLRITISFKIDKEGKVTQVITRTSRPSASIKAEVAKVMKTVPKMISLPMQNGKAVNIKYAIPFTLIVE
ncbi:hypothetical protein H9W90_06820 [Polaribacter pectinis]|uniref:TonB C-terminal domain-containing protein n=1 Tax=Polaribacter pectinis TaxID=2738844 RepID=A0A7G9LDW8_9FLAO|nr:hypothetical protein [Polaribacter pectinis]QNM86817.1 hypothetical protein H9W90_06820 [Polaribacter pectinis]